MTCNLCGNEMLEIFQKIILSKYEVNYFQCSHCAYICTEKPYWLVESYENSINNTDTGMLIRNYDDVWISKKIIRLLTERKGSFLDYAGGYGLFVRMMRDRGFNFYWKDAYTKNLFAIGFEGEIHQKHAMVTAFEVFEHLENPKELFQLFASISDVIFLSTEISPSSVSTIQNWRYLGLEHGQHISFYSQQTFKLLADLHGFKYVCDGKSLHLFVRDKPKIRMSAVKILFLWNKIKVKLFSESKYKAALKDAQKK